MKDPILIASNLHKFYDDNHAVDDVSFTISEGEIFSLLGPNGAGKTTTISMLSCLLSPSRGGATVMGHSITDDPMAVKAVIGVVPQEIALYNSISASENLVFWGRMYGMAGRQLRNRVGAALEIAGLAERASDKVETFSGGMKRRLNIAVGLLHEPELLFLDEPTVGIDPQSRRRILDTIKELNRQGMTVLYTTHYMEEAEELSHRIGIIDHGKLIALGSQSQLTQMIGGHDTLLLELVPDGYDLQLLIGSLKRLPQVAKVIHTEASELDGSRDGAALLALHTPDAEEVLSEVIGYLNNAGAHIRRVEIQEPNLEAVFLHLTGRALRD